MKEFKYTITDPEGIHGKTVYEYDQAGERWKERRLQKDFRYHGTGGKERTGSNPDL